MQAQKRGYSAIDIHPDAAAKRRSARNRFIAIPAPPGRDIVAPGSNFFGFTGITQADQRTAGTGVYANTQFSLEPPDQGLCVGNGLVMETVNNALAIYDRSGTLVGGPTSLSQFYGLAPEIVRAKPLKFGPFLSDPRCRFDRDTQRWFVTELEFDVDPVTGAFGNRASQLIAVSQTADPTGAYSVLSFDTTDLDHPGCPCFGDQPLLGFDANGLYITTNEFPLNGPGFNGAQVYALSKRALAAGVLPTVVHINAGALPAPDGGSWYTIQPATSPTARDEENEDDGDKRGTEYFLSALDFLNAGDNRVAAWALTNTRSLAAAAPNVALQNVVLPSTAYYPPLPAEQKAGPIPLGNLVKGTLEFLNTNDDRMQQVVYAGGRLWAGVNTGLDTGSKTGIAYFVVKPHLSEDDTLTARQIGGGYVAAKGENLLFPSIGVNATGQAVMACTLSGPDYFPSAAYTVLTGRFSSIRLAAAGTAPEDGFTGYAAFGGTGVARWGDYSAAVADADGSIWFAAEYIADKPRTLLANWATFIGTVRANQEADD